MAERRSPVGSFHDETFDEAFKKNMEAIRGVGTITELQYDNQLAEHLTRASEGTFRDSFCSALQDDERFSAEEKRDTLIKHARQDSALAVLRAQRIIDRITVLKKIAAGQTLFVALSIILNAIILYKIW